jgi:hypothetical protein
VTDENARTNANAELQKAYAARRAARALADLGLYDDAASRLYYAVYATGLGSAAAGRRRGLR